jgi:small nuclear ribonucleoprotein (snRNP)-like protein
MSLAIRKWKTLTLVVLVLGLAMTVVPVPVFAATYTQNFDDNSMGGWTNTTVGIAPGTVSVSGGKMNIAAPLNKDIHVVDRNAYDVDDGIYSFSFLPGIGNAGGMFRYTSESSYIWVGYEYSDSAGHWRIRDASGSQPDVFFTTPPLNGNTWYDVKIQFIGQQITVWLNNSQVYSGTLTSLTTTGAGKFGFVVWSEGSAGFKNVVQQDMNSLYYSQSFANNSMGGWTNTTVGIAPGTVSVNGGKMNIAAPLNKDIHVVDMNSNDVDNGIYSFSFLPGSGNGGGMFRYTSESSYMWVGYEYSDSAGHWRIRDASGSHPDVFFTTPPLNGSTWYDVKVQFFGKQITVWLNNNQVYSGTLTSLTTTGAGKIGFVVWSEGNASFKNVVQQAIQDPARMQDITNGTITVSLDKDFPQPLSYKLNASGAMLYGADGFSSPRININGTDYVGAVTGFSSTPDSADYVVSIPDFQVDLAYRFTLEGNALVRSLTGITGAGEPNVQTIRITSPIMKVTAAQTGASAAYYSGGIAGEGGGIDKIGALGALAAANESSPWSFVYTSEAVGAAYNNLTITPFRVQIAGSGSSKYAAIYDNEYNYRFHSIKPGVWFQSKTYISTDINGDGIKDWQDGALWVRGELPPLPAALEAHYQNGGNWSQTHLAFPFDDQPIPEQTMRMTSYPVLVAQQRKLFYETDGLSRQSYETVGWQYKGHDWNWPDWASQPLNPALGGRSEMDWAREEMAKYNADLSFHVNADDISELSNSYQTIPDIAAKDSVGNRKLSNDYFGWNNWYISHFKDLVKGTALSRIDDFVNAYWSPTIVYQDVMLPHTSEDVGYTINDEWYAMKKEIDQWALHGTYATTEYYAPEKRRNGGFSFKKYKTTSRIDHFINAGVTILQSNFLEDEAISGDPGEDYDMLFGYMISSRGRYGNLSGKANLLADSLVKDHYLRNLIQATLRQYSAQQYVEDASKYQVRWGTDLVARLDKSTGLFTLKQGDVLMATGGERFIPSPEDENKIYVYSETGNQRSWTMPSSWAGITTVDRYELTEVGQSFVDRIPVVNGAVTIATLADTPYVLEPGGSEIPEAGPVNQALSQAVHVSSAINTGQHAIDGSVASSWTAEVDDTSPWLEVSFARETTINRAVISEAGNHVTGYSIQYWDEDNQVWQTAYTGTTIGSQATNLFSDIRTTKVRLSIISMLAQPSIKEFGLFADQNLAMSAKASASSNSYNSNGYTTYLIGTAANNFTYRYDVQSSRAMDGTEESFWSAKNETNGAWLQAEFDVETKVNRIVLSEYGNSITSFRIQQWDEQSSSWIHVYQGTTIGARKEIDVPEFTTNKTRLLVDAASAIPGIKEFKIYRTAGVRVP